MSLFVELEDAKQQATSLIDFVEHTFKQGDKSFSRAKADESVAQGKFADAVGHLFGASDILTVLFEAATPVEVDSFFCLVGVVMARIKDEQSATRALDAVLKALCARSDQHAFQRVHALNELYNIFAEREQRYELLKALLQFCGDAKVPQLVTEGGVDVDELVESWRLEPRRARALYKAANDLLRLAQSGRAALEYRVKYLATFADEEASAQQAVAAEAAEAAKQAIVLPGCWKCDHVLQLAAVQQLKSDKNENRDVLFGLLEVFVRGSVTEYEQYQKKHAKALEALGLSHDECRDKMRLLTYASLAATAAHSGRHTLAYDEVASALGVPADDVELWTVKAVSAGVLRAKMDQRTRSVTVNFYVQRYLDANGWKQAATQLEAWTEGIETIIATLNK